MYCWQRVFIYLDLLKFRNRIATHVRNYRRINFPFIILSISEECINTRKHYFREDFHMHLFSYVSKMYHIVTNFGAASNILQFGVKKKTLPH